jgi:hypothetical protein
VLAVILETAVSMDTRAPAQPPAQEAEQLRDALRRAERLRYLADLRLVPQLWEENRISGLVEVLDRHRPQRAGDEDLRGWEGASVSINIYSSRSSAPANNAGPD